MELGSALGPAGQEADDRLADRDGVVAHLGAEDVSQRPGLRLGLVRAQLQLRQRENFALPQQVLDPVARRVDLEPVAGIGGDERAAAAVLLHAEVPLSGAGKHVVELILVEGHADVVDARHAPVTRLHDHVHCAALELREAELEAVAVELLPRDAGLEGDMVVADPPVARDEVETELADVACLDCAQLARHEVVVEEVHATSLPIAVDAPSLLSPWSFEPLQLIPTLAVAALYYRRTQTLASRGEPVSGWRQASFWTGIALVLLAFVSPIDALGEAHFFFMHMLQHGL